MGSEAEFTQILVNLVKNANEAIEGPGDISVTAGRSYAWTGGGRAGEACVELRVSDSGRGLSTGDAERLFEPFYTTSDGAERTGLGLSVVYGIVHRWNGEVRALSAVGSGACFSVTIPALQVLPCAAGKAPAEEAFRLADNLAR